MENSPATNNIRTVADSQLTPYEASELACAEDVIQKGRDTFVRVGFALRSIRDRRLYRATHNNFEDYLEGKWDMHYSQARQLIVAAEVAEEVSPKPATNGSKIPAGESETQIPNERVARAIASAAPKGERKALVDHASKTAKKDAKGNPKLTAAHIEETAAKLKAEETDNSVRPSAEQMVDQVGRAITKLEMVQAFQSREDFRSLDSRICGLKSEFDEICKMQGGALAARHRQQWNATVANLHEILRFAMPYAVCPACAGDGCGNCGTRGWRGEDEWKALPAEMKGGAK